MRYKTWKGGGTVAKQPKKEKPAWFRLDNAALLYSAIQKDSYSAVYRFSAVMTETVDPNALQRAVDRVMPRFPGFRVRMRRGAFWYYLEPMNIPGPMVRPDIANPCQPIRANEGDGWLLRVFFYEKRISLECFHVLSDGAGALVFFRTLLHTYLRELGYDLPLGDGMLNVEEEPRREELEDAYTRYAARHAVRDGWQKTAYAFLGTPEPFYTLNVIMGFVPLDRLKEVSRTYGVSVTEYLAAVLLKVFADLQAKEGRRKPREVALAVPIDLRSHFPSDTLRNFIITIRPSIDPRLGAYTFEEIVSQVHHYMRLNIDRPRMQARFTGNVGFQQNHLLQIIPVALKNPILALSYQLAGVRPYSTTYTNPGAFRVPKEMASHIARMEVMLGQPVGNRVNCASISYGNTMDITFASTIQESDVEREFFRFLVKAGIPVKVESNRTH